MLAAVYLLTADHRLWMQIKHFVERNEIKFDSFKPKDSTENGYTLLCCAKDLCLGTKHITIRNADHKIDACFPISENELYAKLAEIHASSE